MRTRTEKEHKKLMDQIKEIMRPDRRRYLTVFRINNELNMKQTIFHAIFKGKKYSRFLVDHIHFCFLLAHFAQTDLYKINVSDDALERRNENSQKQNLLELAVEWNCFDQATDLLAELQYTFVSIALYCTKTHRIYFRHKNS
jgi:hypothetical protein